MTTPRDVSPMTPERWQTVDAILQSALERSPTQREHFVADACAGDEQLRAEVMSLLGAGMGVTDDFLERPAAEAIGAPDRMPLDSRLVAALAGRYEIEREIGRGGMATVYLARDLRHDRRVAIKVLRPELAAVVGAERFLAEIRVTASLQHPHILPLFDSGGAEGVLWYAMPYVEGETLRSRLTRQRRLPIDEALRLAREVADALEHAHTHGIVHRDVKPENVLLQRGHALVADFGIALALEQAGGERLTRTGLALGTPQYMAPEQASGARTLDARADVYALGVVLHEMLAGESPFAAPTRQGVVQRIMHELPTRLATYRPDVAPSLDAAVRRALAKRPEDRFPSAAAFAAALEAPVESAWQPSNVASPSIASRRRTVSATAAVFVAAIMLVGGTVAGVGLGRSSLVRTILEEGPQPGNAGTATAPYTPAPGELALTIFDRAGQVRREIAAERPWTPRFSPDGRLLAYGAFGAGRRTSDLWVADLEAATTRRLTDDDADANDPQWSADGRSLAFSASRDGGKDVMTQSLSGGASHVLASRDGTQYPSDWLRDGKALLVTEEAGENGHDILLQPADGGPARPVAATRADETGARVSPDGRWVAYTSNATGRAEVYLKSLAGTDAPMLLTKGGGMSPVWRGDGRELFYWRDGALMAMPMNAPVGSAPPAHGEPAQLFRAGYEVGVSTLYDVSPDGQRFVIVRRPPRDAPRQGG